MERRALFLMFASGSAKVPVGGFGNLQYGKLTIDKDYGKTTGLPKAHTWFISRFLNKFLLVIIQLNFPHMKVRRY